ncbi:hypothetical protein Lpp227_08081 [Lacticaseibacillus paracasei subsp. paracasei Lpp227]|nr:hypothetical protein Lpp227_08081 [Lacticaseibacillus paracasei subsp. paracasei Lpp227]
MKKTLLLIPAVLLLFTAGCGQNSQSSSKSGSVRTTQSSKKTAKASTSQKQKRQPPRAAVRLAQAQLRVQMRLLPLPPIQVALQTLTSAMPL